MEDHEVQSKAQCHGTQQNRVDPWGHHYKRLIFRQAVDSITHFNGDQNGQGHGHGFRSLENIAAQALELFGFIWTLQEMRELVVAHLGSGGVVQEPVGGATDSGETNIDTNGHIAEKQPGCNQSLLGGPENNSIKILLSEIVMYKDDFFPCFEGCNRFHQS